ncbi:Rox3-domain-containing protein [Patellaria atrata CBS 101060]|uniref:Mediator of RNA polymerase II transcription subunit 19 n=1 Tax=Patellaria atrata CBS 101060 TaxID=1346257 RepID=A0A9P4VU43_9PEZI|nr:Rox3-domain-containing protein [Patellaria atrata CBS 101060]
MSASPSSKRQRLSGSFSPASPPYHLAKQNDDTKTIVQPNTPTSPPYMSSINHSNASQSSNTATQRSDYTPPSSAVLSSQTPQHPMITTTNTLPTPASSTTGGLSSMNKDSDGDAPMIDDHNGDSQLQIHDIAMTGMEEHRRTDHERQDSDFLRKVGAIERLTTGLSPLYKLNENPIPLSRPHGTQDMIQLYGLQPIASKYLRKDPVTGEKINKLRKSYEGQIKTMGLAGKNKHTKTPGVFTGMMSFPAEEWQVQKVDGRNVAEGLPASILSKLDSAVKMAPGKLPPSISQTWRSIVGTDDAPSKPTKPQVQQQASAGNRPVGAPSPTIKAARPERSGTKRRYLDSSFTGYGEGFVDDDTADTSGGEDDRRKKNKKPRGYSWDWCKGI